MLAIRAARLLPGAGAPAVSPVMVLAEAGRVLDVDGRGNPPPPGVEVVDLGDATLVPGLVDAHLHLGFDAGSDVVTPLLEDDDAAHMATMEAGAAATLASGVTTARDLGDRRYLSLVLRERLRTDPALGPELLVSGPPITRTGGHCWFLGGEADGVAALEAAVAERADRGCDVVKVMATGGVLTPGFPPHESQYGPEELGAVVATARSRGLPVAAHAHGRQGVVDSVNAGVDSVEHCTFFGAEGVDFDWPVIHRMAALGTYAGFTLAVIPGMSPPPVVARALEVLYATVEGVHRAGARIVCSSDAGIAPSKPHGVLPHGVVLLAGLGLTNAEAIETATGVAAACCGVGDRKGRVAAGFDADLVALDGDPRADIRSLLRPVAVFRAGVRVP
ncbi:MAG TPA: amidohydrolase family protein [Acidimicrobiales bacterium]|nr:amidohydrolase family protein [Acidimicrobiales bacterium]